MRAERGARGRGYTVITPANHYPSRLPQFADVPVIKLVTPRLAPARIGQYLVALGPGDATVHVVDSGKETFLYVLEGDASLSVPGSESALSSGGYAYVPATAEWEIEAGELGAKLVFIRRTYDAFSDLRAPAMCVGHRDDEPFSATAVPGFTRRELLPVEDPAFDFAMSLLAFEPDVGLGKIEIHDEEHGLLMTRGSGTYTLDADQHMVRAGDFIYMAPYCPQGFSAGPDGAEYLLYKDAWRDGF